MADAPHNLRLHINNKWIFIKYVIFVRKKIVSLLILLKHQFPSSGKPFRTEGFMLSEMSVKIKDYKRYDVSFSNNRLLSLANCYG